MKRLVYLLLPAFLFVGCAVTNRIIVTDHDKDGLKNIRLKQSPEARAEGAEKEQSAWLDNEVFIGYLLEEKTAVRPLITLEANLPLQVMANNSEPSVIMVLDNENIPLPFFRSIDDSLEGEHDSSVKETFMQKYLIPENLWISIVHSKEISYRIMKGEMVLVEIFLNQTEKEKLSEFMKMAIRQRDIRFPAIPEGQVKW